MRVLKRDLTISNMEENKVYFKAGDIVTLNKNIPNKPIMMVIRKESRIFKKQDDSNNLRGIRCIWFTVNGELQEGVFNTKDIEIIK